MTKLCPAVTGLCDPRIVLVVSFTDKDFNAGQLQRRTMIIQLL